MHILLYFIIICFIFRECTSEDTVLLFLTQNRTQKWYRNLQQNISRDNPYCSICCISTSRKALGKTCGKHTMCIYNEGRVGAACKGFLKVPLTEEEIEAIVDMHNTIRNKVAMGLEDKANAVALPMASNMKTLEWDKELALVADRWAAQCIFGYDMCRDVGRYPVGQNIAKGKSAYNNAVSFIIDWYNNVDMLGKEDIRYFQIGSTDALSQYTQLIWAETYQIGCARVVFQQAKGANVTYREHFICNYGPTGNIPGQPIYRIGEPCSSCADGTACTVEYPGLCGSETRFEVNLERRVRKKSSVQDDENGSQKVCPNVFFGSSYFLLLYTYYIIF